MAVGAGIGSACLIGQVRPGNPETVIPAAVDLHVGTLDHVAGLALRRFRTLLMEMMRRIIVKCLAKGGEFIVSSGRMALGANRVAFKLHAG